MESRLRRLGAALILSISIGVAYHPIRAIAAESAANATASPQVAPADSLIIQRYRNALDLDPSNAQTRFQLGIALIRERRYADALAELSTISDAMPDNADVHYYMGVAYAGVGELEKAFMAYENVIRISPETARSKYELEKAFYNLGIARQKGEDMPGALKAYRRSIDLAPEQTLAYCRSGEVYFNLKSYAESVDQLLICDTRTPGDPQTKRNIISARLAKGLGLVGEKKYTEALTEFRKVTEMDPGNESAVYFQGYLYYQVADYKQALETLGKLRGTESADIYRNIPALLQNIAVELQAREDWTTAEKALRQAVALRKDDADLHYLLGYNLMKQNDYTGAQQEIKEALRFNPTHSSSTLALAIISEKLVETHLTKAETALANNEYAAASVEFKAAYELDPKNARAINGIEVTDGKLKELRAEAADKLERNIREGLASADKEMREERYKEALAAYRYVLAFDPHSPAALQGMAAAEAFITERLARHIQSGDAFMEVKRYNLAIKEYRAALNYVPDDTLSKSKLDGAEFKLGSIVNPFLDEAAEKESQEYLGEAAKAYAAVLVYDPENATAVEGKRRTEENLETGFDKYLSDGKRALLDRDYIKAAEDLRMAVRLKPDNNEAIEGLAKATEWLDKTIAAKLKAADKSFQDSNYTEAATGYEDVLALDPKNFNAQEGLQKIKRQVADDVNKKLAAAEAAYHQGQYYRAYIGYGEALQLDKDNEDARAMRLQSRQKLDESVAPVLKSAIDASSRGDDAGALIDFKKVLNADPSNETAKRYLNSIDKSKARKSISAKVDKLYLTGVDLYTRGKYVEAIKTWEELLALDPNHDKAARNITKAKRKLEGVMDVK
ncbi:MAG: tetratricopeptide repeat protein [Deltaproteobacteria bacterium]|nr:tetratricopeptide repeat protein [Deltaproteobacteria bacterium]